MNWQLTIANCQFIVAQFYILNICFNGGIPALQVVEGMVSNSVSIHNNLSKNIRMLSDIITNAKKCCFRLYLFQLSQNKLRHLRHWPIVKGEVEFFFLSRNFPDEISIKPREEKWTFKHDLEKLKMNKAYSTRQESMVISSR